MPQPLNQPAPLSHLTLADRYLSLAAPRSGYSSAASLSQRLGYLRRQPRASRERAPRVHCNLDRIAGETSFALRQLRQNLTEKPDGVRHLVRIYILVHGKVNKLPRVAVNVLKYSSSLGDECVVEANHPDPLIVK